MRRFRVVRIERQHAHADAFEPPLRGAADRAEPDDADGLAAELPRPVALVGDLPARVDLARAHVVIGGDEPAVHREHEPDRDLGDGVRVAARRAQHGDPGRGRGRDVDVVGVAATRADAQQREVENRTFDGIRFDDQQVRALGLDARRELLAVVEAQRNLVDPRVVHDVGERLEGLHSFTAKGCGDERSGSIRHLCSFGSRPDHRFGSGSACAR